jgi:hypothetical protein
MSTQLHTPAAVDRQVSAHAAPSPRSAVRVGAVRSAGVAAIVAGVVMIVSPFALSLAGNANGGERILNRFRSTMSTAGLAGLKSSYTTVADMSNQFFSATLPDLRSRLHESPAAFQADLERHYPAVAKASVAVPPVFALVNPKVPGLLALHDDFARVDSLPFLGLPVSSVPWILLGLGVGVTLVGVATVTTRRRAGVALIAVTGAALVGVPLALSIPTKADASVSLVRAGRFVFSPKIAPAALATTDTLDQFVSEAQSRFLPQTAARLHESTAQLGAQLAKRYPAVVRGLAAWPLIRPVALQRARYQVTSVEDFANIEGIDFRAVSWVVIGPGMLMLIVRAGALVASRAARRPARARPAG